MTRPGASPSDPNGLANVFIANVLRDEYCCCDDSGQKIGVVTSGSPSPTLGKNIALAYVPPALSAVGTTVYVEIRGQTIRAGDSVLMWYPSANRDEDVFPDPYRFDITRHPNEHLAFGHHEHFCLGAGFAKKEIKVMFEELFRRFPDIQLDGPPVRLRSNFINGVKRLPVRLTKD